MGTLNLALLAVFCNIYMCVCVRVRACACVYVHSTAVQYVSNLDTKFKVNILQVKVKVMLALEQAMKAQRRSMEVGG